MRLLLSSLACLVCTSAAAAPWWNDDFSRRVKLTFDNASRGEELVDFPVLVSLDADRFDYGAARAAGQDLRFVDDDGAVLDHEIERWDATGTSSVWVRIPKIGAGSAVDHVWLYYGSGAAADGQNVGGVWSNGYVAVWHFDGDLLDSARRGHFGTNDGTVEVPSVIGRGRDFDGDASVYVSREDDLDFPTAMTVSVWFEVEDFDKPWQALVTKGDSAWRLHRYSDSDELSFGTYHGGWQDLQGATPVNDGAPHWAAAVFDRGVGRFLYIDGELDASAAESRAMGQNTWNVAIGDNLERPGRGFVGLLDEVRISGVARSADWISAQYASMTDAFVSFCDAPREICDGIDNDCDGLVDDADPGLDPSTRATFYDDVDADGYGDPATGTLACAAPPGAVRDDRDCDDADPAIHPGAVEVCDGVDNDCDGLVDDADPDLDLASAGTWYADADADGFGDPDASVVACAPVDGAVLDATDCDDADPTVNPDAVEVCDEVDHDCDGDPTNGLATEAWYADADGDGYGDPSVETVSCAPVDGYVLDATDCDDADPEIHPGAEEIPGDGVDQDCDGHDAPVGTSSRAWEPDTGEHAPAAAGCGCATGGRLPVAWLLLALIVPLRRR